MTTLNLHRVLPLKRSLADVFRYLRDFDNIEQWDPGVFTAEREPVGSVHERNDAARQPAKPAFALQLNVMGRAVPMRYTLDVCEPPSEQGQARLVLTGSGDGFTAVDTLTLSATGANACTLDYRADITTADVPALLMPVLNWWGERLSDAAMNGLKDALEHDDPVQLGALARLAERLVLPGMINYTRRGYRKMPSRGLSRYLDGQRIGISGVTSGLGLACAQQLARLGADLVLVGRGAERLAQAAETIRPWASHDIDIHLIEAELSSITSTRALSQQLLALERPLDVWINNAGALFDSQALTSDGLERTMAVNFVAPALLTQALAPMLAARSGRIIQVVSGGLYTQGIRLDDMAFANEPFNGPKAYARAKRALLDVSQYWATQYRGLGLHIMHPGWAATPGVASALPDFNQRMGKWLRNARQGSDTAVWLASHPVFAQGQHSGEFWFDRARRPGALLPNTASSKADVQALISWYEVQISV
jgi:NAD(P)-dependent dehydrogenase (short-subunit alcohol dehydrogenase family)